MFIKSIRNENILIPFNYQRSKNIYLRIFDLLGDKKREIVRFGYRENLTQMSEYRTKLTSKYSFAIPCEYTLRTICSYSPIVEIGAGSGYWAYLIKECGGDIIAYDNYSWEWCLRHDYFNVKKMEVNQIMALPETHKRTLFLCWPNYNTSFAYDCARMFKGEYLIFIGEGYGGCTGNDAFFNLLDKKYTPVEDCKMIQWPYINDWFNVYKRKGF